MQLVKDGDNVHFCMVDDKALYKIDLGIGLVHFDVVVKAQGIKGEYKKVEQVDCAPFEYAGMLLVGESETVLLFRKEKKVV